MVTSLKSTDPDHVGLWLIETLKEMHYEARRTLATKTDAERLAELAVINIVSQIEREHFQAFCLEKLGKITPPGIQNPSSSITGTAQPNGESPSQEA